MKRLMIGVVFLLSLVFVGASAPAAGGAMAIDPKMTPAYEVLVLRKVAVEAELIDLSTRFTPEASDVHARRLELSLVKREMERMHDTEPLMVSKLSRTYGNLLLRNVTLEVELAGLLTNFTSTHPVVERKRAEILVLQREIAELLKWHS